MERIDEERWKFYASSPQTALMLGSEKDPNDESVDWVEECNRLADGLIDKWEQEHGKA